MQNTLAGLGLDPALAIAITNESDEKTKDMFANRINDPSIAYRVFLLVNMGTEGWNVPSLFATALAREIKSSNNFVLQAASRCLRQVPGNNQKAKIYLRKRGFWTASFRDLRQTLADLNATLLNERTAHCRKFEIPPLMKKLSRYQKQLPQITLINKPATIAEPPK